MPDEVSRQSDALPVFICRRCGECCNGRGGIVLLRKDSERLAIHLGLSLSAFQTKFTETVRGKRGLVCAKGGTEGGACIFFCHSGCSVHEAKPDICRAWPFFRGNLVDPGSLNMARQGCPGILPEAGFSEFARAGARHLLERGIVAPPDETACPAALLPEESLRRIAGEDVLPYPEIRTYTLAEDVQ